MEKLTPQEKTITKCCIMAEINRLEMENLTREKSTKEIDIINYNHNIDTINFLKNITKKIEGV